MKAKILTDSNNLLTMFRLGAIEGELVNSNNFDLIFNKSIKDRELGILIITMTVYDAHKLKIDDFRRENTMPLIVTIDG